MHEFTTDHANRPRRINAPIKVGPARTRPTARTDHTQSQSRAARLLAIPLDPRWSRESVALRLQAAGAPGSGIPSGHTPAAARRMADDELLGLLRGGEAAPRDGDK